MLSNIPFLGKIIRFFAKHFLLLVVGVGLLLLLFSHFKWLSGSVDEKVFEISGKLGELILAGGMFSAIVKSNFFMNVIGKELEKTLLSSTLFEHVDFERALVRFLALCYKNSLPKLAEKFDDDLVKNTFPVGNDWYVSSKDISIQVEWVDQKKEAVKLTQRMKVKYIAKDKETIVKHNAEFCPMMGNAIESYDTKFENIRVNNVSISGEASKYVKSQSGSKVVLEMSGCDEYEVFRRSSAVIDLEKDPTLYNAAETYTAQIDVNINVVSGDIGVLFTEVGIRKPFEDQEDPPEGQDGSAEAPLAANSDGTPNGYRISKVYRGLILPEQGFMLIFVRRSSNPPQPSLPEGEAE